jgi:hypothetical protein
LSTEKPFAANLYRKKNMEKVTIMLEEVGQFAMSFYSLLHTGNYFCDNISFSLQAVIFHLWAADFETPAGSTMFSLFSFPGQHRQKKNCKLAFRSLRPIM